MVSMTGVTVFVNKCWFFAPLIKCVVLIIMRGVVLIRAGLRGRFEGDLSGCRH